MSDPKRRNIRFQPDMDSIAQLDLNSDHNVNQFEVQLNGIITDESYSGCGIVTLENTKLKKGSIIIAKIGNLGPIGCEIVWVKKLDENVLKVGLQYID